MAGEEIFTASAVLSVATIGVFTVLFLKANGETMKKIWLGAIMLALLHAFNVQRIGFNATGLYDLRDMTFTIMEGMMDLLIGLMFLMFIGVAWDLLNALMKILEGRYGKAD